MISVIADNFTSELERVTFKVVHDHLIYLGLKIPRNPKLLFKLNYSELVAKLNQNMESWRILPLSMMGRINAIAMVSPPRFLYLGQNLPIFLTSSFFKDFGLDNLL